MSKLKTAVIYYSSTGCNYKLANMAKEGAEKAGSEAKIFKVAELAPESVISNNPAWQEHVNETKHIPEVTLDDLEWADVIVFSAPTRFGNVPSQLKQFLDMTGPLWQKGKLINKVVTGMTSAMNPHGGQEATLLSLYTTMYHWGAIVVAPGYTDEVLYAAGGNPYGTSVSVDMKGNMVDDVESTKKAVEHQVKRAISVADALAK
ncbi:NAD(P)H:quinone oxidoreductase [Fulvivirga sediminis]|uniref:NAD(P)H:quinone oxidoreductase n=1 Tax=Fulvivirga sediminis TaxID=2803949 RepID=A0A937F322_9BACT|nr:NAD(P)H:quinone oxidoreductase [Fulvivirga sediminis]MBL3655412.1 NAD(P)H:quinone oxidoreductase [Fulvivirga sediminis]